MDVAVIGGGMSSEHEVSLASAEGIRAALQSCGHRVRDVRITRNGLWECDGEPLGTSVRESLARALDALDGVDVLFPAMHGPAGEDGTIAALAELVGIPCVFSPLVASAVAMDKWATRAVATSQGIAVAPGRLITQLDEVPADVALPAVVKPVAAGSSHGVVLVSEPAELPGAIREAQRFDRRVLIEERIIGREVDIAIRDLPDGTVQCGPVLEIVVASGGLFDEEEKYGGAADFRIPAELTSKERQSIEDGALTMYRALGCRSLARIDFFLTPAGPVLIEVNTIPGFTEHSQVPRMFAAAGISYPQLVDDLVRSAR